MIKCEIIRDLLPLYIDECCSGESKRVVKKHLAQCSKCRKLYYTMNQEIGISVQEREKNISEEELLKTGKEVIKKELKRDIIEKLAVVDIPVDIMIITAILYIYINRIEITFRDNRLYERGSDLVTVLLCVTGVIAGVIFLIKGRKNQDSVPSRFLVVLSIVWKLETFLVFLAFAILTLFYQI